MNTSLQKASVLLQNTQPGKPEENPAALLVVVLANTEMCAFCFYLCLRTCGEYTDK